MLDKIESLRKQPKHVRNRYAFWIALSITLLIALLWALTISARLSPADKVPQEHADDAGSFSRTLRDITQRVKEALAEVRTQVKYESEEQGPEIDKPEIIDLNALIASSSKEKATNTDPYIGRDSRATSTHNASTSVHATTTGR